MSVIYIGTILLFRVIQHICNKKSSNLIQGRLMFLSYSGIRQLISAAMGLLLILAAGEGFICNTKTVIISALSGTMLVASMFCSLYALKSGMVALVSLFSTAGLIVPCLAGVFMFGVPIYFMQWVGLGLFLIAAYLMIASSAKFFGKFSLKTFLLLLGTLLSNGGTMLAQQMFTQYVPNGDVSVFSFLSFGIVGVILLLAVPSTALISGEKPQPLPKNLLLYGFLLSLAVFIINQLATTATAIVSPIILFTFINGGSTIIAAIVAAILFQEKLTVQCGIGITLGIAALVIIKIFA